MKATIFSLAVLLVFSMNGLAHGGGLNKCGCHMDRKTNTCHCHRSPYAGCGDECYSRLSPWPESSPFFALTVSTPADAQRSPGARTHKSTPGSVVRVRPHTTKRGTYVKPHARTAPNKAKADNWSTKGNVNPTTGKKGTQR